MASVTDLIEEAALAAPESRVRDRWFRRSLVLATLLGMAIRIPMLLAKLHQELMVNDSLYYTSQAQNNFHGRWFKEFFGVGEGAEHAPLTSLILTPFGHFDPPMPWMRAAMTVIGIAIVPLVGVLGNRIGGRRVGVVAALLAAVYPNIWMSDSLIMSETIANLLIVAGLIVAVKYRERYTWQLAVLLGATIGLAGLARAEVLIFAPLLALIGCRRGAFWTWAGRVVVIGAATFAVISPWVIHNLSRFDEQVVMSTNEGPTFLGANCAESYYGSDMGGWSILCLYDTVDRGDEDTSVRNNRQRQQAIDYANGHRSRIPFVVGARLLRTFDLYGLSDMIRGDKGEERYEWSVIAGMIGWWVLAPLAAIGVWRARRTAAIVLVVPATCVLVTSVLFYGSHRLRSPVETALVVAAALMLTRTRIVREAIDRQLARRLAR